MPFEQRLLDRAAHKGIKLSPAELAQLGVYFELLARWNPKINLTALPLGDPPDSTLDRLFIEPLAAAALFPSSSVTWFDVGSGGGSPAIPLKVLRPAARLMMVESRGRKAAFLREVIRQLNLAEATVAEERFEAVAERTQAHAAVITVRAVRVDDGLFEACRSALKVGGKFLIFQSSPVGSVQFPAGWKLAQQLNLSDSPAFLSVLERR